MRIKFEKVSVKGIRYWTENGKRRQETREFFQTISPFNLTTDGGEKTRRMILEEITAERDEWQKRNPLEK